MRKETMLYISPFWPKKTGISEYSEALIQGLEKYYEVTLLTDDYIIQSKEIKKRFKILKYSELSNIDKFSVLLYNFGNNPDGHEYMYDLFLSHPGYVILHDFSLYYLTIAHYKNKNSLYQKIYEIEGIEGIKMIKDSLKSHNQNNLLLHKHLAADLPMNKEIIDMARGIFVHSKYTENEIKKINENLKVYKINLVKCETKKEFKKENFIKEYFDIKESAPFIIGAVGFIGPSKQNRLSCMAVKEYNKTHIDKIHYVMIGEGNYVDDLLDEYIHKTNFLENNEYFEAINACDLILNLRYPYNGESSATLIQCMAMNKLCVITDIGWFSEIPDNCVRKVPISLNEKELANVINDIKNSKNLVEYFNNARNYVNDNCLAEKVADSIFNFLINDRN